MLLAKDKAAKPLRLGTLRGLAGHTVEEVLDLDLNDQLEGDRIDEDEELADDIGTA